VKIYFIKSIN